ncbi:uncharacterized protein LOC142578054 [Dermacentor variabilis]|uniref:uncharacterized protein LOC142578054 n=1 Tax=Dermacentor variabilis TaxID=34621 RepID=UPI003F5B54B6
MNLSRMQAAKERNKRASARHSQVCAGATFKTKRVSGHNSIPYEDQMEVEQSSHEATRESGAGADTIHKEEDAVEALLQLAASGNDKNQAEKSVQVDSLSIVSKKLNLAELLSTDNAVRAFTGVQSVKTFHSICSEVAAIDNNSSEVSVLERVALVLVRLKTCLPFHCLGALFNISKATVHRLFYCTLCSLAAVLECAIPWSTTEEIQKNMPLCFSDFSEVRVILDCTEVEVEKSHCASCRILTYSPYKGTHTAKVLVGVSPAGLITFVSSAFGGRASDKACVEKSEVLQKLTSFQDDVMVDKGFNIDDICTKLGLGIIQPPFLRSQQQFSAADASKTLKIARARVHVERAIQRMKVFKVLKGPVPWEMTGAPDQIFTVIAGIVNLSTPILSDIRF